MNEVAPNMEQPQVVVFRPPYKPDSGVVGVELGRHRSCFTVKDLGRECDTVI